MSEAPLLTDEAKALIGKDISSVTFEISKQDIHKLALAIGDLNPLYLDEDAARKSRYGGIIAHPMQYMTNPYGLVSQLGRDGRPEGRQLPMKFTGAMGGGAEIEFFAPVRPGDTITARRKIAEITDRQSSKKGWIAPVTYETTCINQKGEVVAVARETTVYF